MTDKSACPDPEQIFAALDAAGSAAGLDPQLGGHIEACPRCREIAAEAAQLRGISQTLANARLNERDRERIERWKAGTLDVLRLRDDRKI